VPPFLILDANGLILSVGIIRVKNFCMDDHLCIIANIRYELSCLQITNTEAGRSRANVDERKEQVIGMLQVPGF